MIFLAFVVTISFIVWFVAVSLDKQEQNPTELDR